MARTSEQAVRSIIETDASVSIVPFIDTANSLVTWLDSQDSQSLLSTATLELIERYLAAHFYQCNRDRNFSSKTTGSASATYQGQTAMVLMSTDPGQTACLLDVTGNLALRSQEAASPGKRVASMLWLGQSEDSPRPDSKYEGDLD